MPLRPSPSLVSSHCWHGHLPLALCRGTVAVLCPWPVTGSVCDSVSEWQWLVEITIFMHTKLPSWCYMPIFLLDIATPRGLFSSPKTALTKTSKLDTKNVKSIACDITGAFLGNTSFNTSINVKFWLVVPNEDFRGFHSPGHLLHLASGVRVRSVWFAPCCWKLVNGYVMSTLLHCIGKVSALLFSREM